MILSGSVRIENRKSEPTDMKVGFNPQRVAGALTLLMLCGCASTRDHEFGLFLPECGQISRRTSNVILSLAPAGGYYLWKPEDVRDEHEDLKWLDFQGIERVVAAAVVAALPDEPLVAWISVTKGDLKDEEVQKLRDLCRSSGFNVVVVQRNFNLVSFPIMITITN